MNKFSRVIRYTKLHFFRDPIYFCLFVINYFNQGYVPKIKYHGIDTVTRFLEEGKSVIRFGDGEIFILNGGSLPGQKFDLELKRLMSDCITTYTENSPYVVCLNRAPLEKPNSILQKEGLIPCWLPSKVYFNLYFNKQQKYLDAAMFYFGDTIPKYFEKYLLTKKVILISNKDNIKRFADNKNIPFKDVLYIETVPKDAFSDYEKIKTEALSLIERYGKNNVVILAAFGPTSKALAYEFAFEGVQVIDIGQGIEVAYSDKKLYQNLDMLK